jgi:hypothetical protein
MTLAEAGEIFGYWRQCPPAHQMLQTIARLLGWTPREVSPEPPRARDLAAAPPPGLAVARDAGIGMPDPVLDPEALRARNLDRAAAIARRNRDSDGN